MVTLCFLSRLSFATYYVWMENPGSGTILRSEGVGKTLLHSPDITPHYEASARVQLGPLCNYSILAVRRKFYADRIVTHSTRRRWRKWPKMIGMTATRGLFFQRPSFHCGSHISQIYFSLPPLEMSRPKRVSSARKPWIRSNAMNQNYRGVRIVLPCCAYDPPWRETAREHAELHRDSVSSGNSRRKGRSTILAHSLC